MVKSNNDKVVIPQNKAEGSIPKWAVAALIVFTALLYGRSLYNGLTLMDDDYYIINNPFLKDFSWHGVKAIFSSFYSANYNPFTTLTWWFEYNTFGLNPFPYHVTNLLLHLLNTLLVFKLSERLSGKQITALVVTVLFAIHPMHVESVAWVSERKDVLYTAFYLLSLLVYLRYLSLGLNAKYYWGVLLLFLAALFSKSAAVTLPVLLVVIDVYKGRKINGRAILEKVPFLLLSVVFGVVNIIAQGAVGAINDLTSSYGFVNRIFLFTSGLAAYLTEILVPLNLAVIHYLPTQNNGMLPWMYYASLPVLLIIGWAIARRSAFRKEIVFGVAFFLVAISVMLQVLAVGSMLFAERYTYVPYIGLFYLIGQMVSAGVEGKNGKAIIGVLSAVVILYSIASWQRMAVWNNDDTIVADIIDHNPDIYYGYWMRGNLEKAGGKLQEALQDYSHAIDLNNKFDDSYFNRGVIYDNAGNIQAAIQDYSKAITINPKSADAYNNRGWAYFRSGDVRSSINDFNQAIALKPGYAQAYNNRGWVHFNASDTLAALADYNKSIAADSVFSRPLYNRASLRTSMGDLAGAINDYNSLLKLNPEDNSIYYYRGLARLNIKDNAGACQDWNKAKTMGNEKAGQLLSQYCK